MSQLPQELVQHLNHEEQHCQNPQAIVSQVLKSYSGDKCFHNVHIVLENLEEICLSRSPVPDCSGSLINSQSQLVCNPTEQVEKTVSYTCLSSQDSRAQQFKLRAIQGQVRKVLSPTLWI